MTRQSDYYHQWSHYIDQTGCIRTLTNIMEFYILFYISVCFLYEVYGYNITYVQQDTDSECWQRVSHNGGIIFSHPGHHSYAENTDCKVTLVAKPGLKIAIRFDSFDITDSHNCYQDELLVYDGPALSSLRLTGTMKGLCGRTMPEAFKYLVSTGNEMTIRFITGDVLSKSIGFTVIYSTVYPDDQSEDCFPCSEGDMCIHKDLKCDGLPNCKDGSDELRQSCYPPTTKETTIIDNGWNSWMGTAFGVAVAFGIFFVVIIILIVCISCGCSEPENRAEVSDTHSYESAIEPMIISAKPRNLSPGCRLSAYSMHQPLTSQLPTLGLADRHVELSNVLLPPIRQQMLYLPESTIGLLHQHCVALPPEHA
ncbi:uncharacterized protein [Antedon mediterranea]|uniref:uncharacterized protein n=1 Tax=Antedon mediterranea TaxID=105859 RepID=UPI003AF556FE